LTRLDLDDARIVVDGDVGVVTVRAILEGTFDGIRCDGVYAYARTWRRAGGRWQIVAGGVRAEPGPPG